MLRRRFATAVAVALTLTACASSGADANEGALEAQPVDAPAPTEQPDARDARPFTVTKTEMTLVDDTRPTPESDNGPQLTTRTVGLRLYLPDSDDPSPLVVFSHGMGGHPDAFEELHTVWAEAGYAVAAPIFPLSNRDAKGGFTNLFDVPGQPGDVSFVVDHLLSEFAERIDPDRMAAAGLSAGGATTYEVGINDMARDDRFDSAIVFAGQRYTNTANGTFEAPTDHPVLILHGDADPLIPLSAAAEAYADLVSPRYFATLLGGGHAGPFQDAGEGIEVQVPGMSELVHESTLAFLDRYVLGIEDAEGELLAALDDPELAIFVHDS